MTFLALETSGDLAITGAVLGAAVLSSLTVRSLFGYSFSTWRLHLRGETIRSSHDVAWMRSLTVGRMMRQDVRTDSVDTTLDQFRRRFPLGSTQRVVVLDNAGRYAGIVSVTDAHTASETDDPARKNERIGALLHLSDEFLLPAMTIKEAMAIFDRTESEALAVLRDVEGREVLGMLTEAHALRRYAEEADQANRNLLGTF
jgi:CIC family chloride channel protein